MLKTNSFWKLKSNGMMLFIVLIFNCCEGKQKPLDEVKVPVSYYIDSENGNDANKGTGENIAWKSFLNLNGESLNPGDSIKFKRGSKFSGLLIISESGNEKAYITLTSYGDNSQPAPSFTNPVFINENYGNCIRLKGNYIKVENLYFHNTPSYPNDYPNDHFLTIWEMGAIHIEHDASHCIIANNEIVDCPAGIKSNGQNITITGNYIHDCNRILKEWGWGPLGIWLGNDFQKVIHNTIINYRVEDPRITWAQGIGGGADGGALEIDDARNNKSNIEIAYNYTRDCQGFLEVTYRDVKTGPDYKNFKIHHNISDDYQQFIALWAGRNCYFENNTIIRRKKNVNDWGVFNIAQNNSGNSIRNNIIVTGKNIPIFNVGLQGTSHPKCIIQRNLYYAATDTLNFGSEDPGSDKIIGNPMFLNYNSATSDKDFRLKPGSPAIDRGLNLNYRLDYNGTNIPEGKGPDIGAFEN